ncbi:MAG TPA: hypothetical protein VF541_22065 [Longimicrobium sp.]|jgi:ABC-type sugar transport system substrate-binding protein
MQQRTKVDISRMMREHVEIDAAVAEAFADAVRRHRAAGVPMVFSENGTTVLKDPFDVAIPGENGKAGEGSGEV